MVSSQEKQLMAIIGMILFILAGFIFLRFRLNDTGYSDDPEDWITAQGVDVREATGGLSYINTGGQQFDFDEVETVFSSDGIYEGNYFKNQYIDNGETLIRFSENLNPNNGIPEGFIVEKFENSKPVVYVFLDEDWRNSIGDTNIIWGENYQNSESFIYDKEVQGIYYNKIDDDKNRFRDDYKIHYGGIVVGKVSREQIQNNDLKKTILLRLI